MFCCFTGLAYADVKKLTHDDFVTGIDGELWINSKRAKTKTKSNIPVLPTAMMILEKYEDRPFLMNGRVPPVLTSQKMNAYLKEIADLSSIKKHLTILITAYSEYAIEGYELNVVDYLLKPVKFDRFFQAIAKVLESLNQKKNKKDIPIPDTSIAHDYIFVKSDYKAIKVKFEEILYIEGMQKYVQFRRKEEQVTTLMSLSKLNEILPTKDFLRIQKSFIANLNHTLALRETG